MQTLCGRNGLPCFPKSVVDCFDTGVPNRFLYSPRFEISSRHLGKHSDCVTSTVVTPPARSGEIRLKPVGSREPLQAQEQVVVWSCQKGHEGSVGPGVWKWEGLEGGPAGRRAVVQQRGRLGRPFRNESDEGSQRMRGQYKWAGRPEDGGKMKDVLSQGSGEWRCRRKGACPRKGHWERQTDGSALDTCSVRGWLGMRVDVFRRHLDIGTFRTQPESET